MNSPPASSGPRTPHNNGTINLLDSQDEDAASDDELPPASGIAEYAQAQAARAKVHKRRRKSKKVPVTKEQGATDAAGKSSPKLKRKKNKDKKDIDSQDEVHGSGEGRITVEDKGGDGPPPPPAKITFALSTFPSTAMMGKNGKRLKKPNIGGKCGSFALRLDEPFDTFKAQLLAKTNQLLKVKKYVWEWFEVQWTIARIHPSTTVLESEGDYAIILDKVESSKKTEVEVKLQVTELGKRRDSVEEVDADDHGISSSDHEEKPPKKKTKVRKEADLSEHEVRQAEIKDDLAVRWKCEDKTCASSVCYVLEDHGRIHVPIAAREFTIWIEGIIKGPLCATLEKPPNHHLFDPDPNKRSSLLTARLAAKNRDAPPQQNAPNQPVIHIHNHIGANGGGVEAVPDARPARPADPNEPATNIGPPLSLDEFTNQFNLPFGLKKKLEDIGCTGPDGLSYLDMSDVRTEAGLNLGELGNLKSAMARWRKLV